MASRNFLKPNLDLDARYGLRGFGHELADSDPGQQSSYSNLFTADHQEWQVGLEFSMPLGFRQGNAAVRNAELRLGQARTVLCEGERTVISELSAAVAEVDRAYALLQTDIYRTKAAKDQLAALTAVYQAKQEGFFEVLDAQRRLSEAISHYYQSRVQYALAIRNVHFEKGSLLDYCDVSLAEGAWPDKAYRDAIRRAEHRGHEKSIDYAFAVPPVVSAGAEAEILRRASSSSPANGSAPAAPMPPSAPDMRRMGSSGVWELFLPEVGEGSAVQIRGPARLRWPAHAQGRPLRLPDRAPADNASVVHRSTATPGATRTGWRPARAPTCAGRR